MLSSQNVVAVIVTYGLRFSFAKIVAEAAHNLGVGRVVVVDNGSPLANQADIEAFAAENSGWLKVIRLDENHGSAGGYRAGIEAAATESADFLWLLDDDNKPLSNSFEKLRLAYEYLGADPNAVLLSLRPNRQEYLNAVKTGSLVGIKPGTFMGFSWSSWFRAKIGKLISRVPAKDRVFVNCEVPETLWAPLTQIGYAPYGGLLFHKQWLSRIGFPDARLYLYGDDHEYSLRIRSDGGKIYLCGESIIEELEDSWSFSHSKIPIFMRKESDEVKIYCLIRNRVYIEGRLEKSEVFYFMNRAGFFCAQIIPSLLFGAGLKQTIRRARLMLAAEKSGRSGDFKADTAGRPIMPISDR